MFDKFLFGNKQIPEMYFGNIPVVQIYFGNTLVWEKSSAVPYDNTCTATITLSQDETAWIVTITKDGEDVTSSLSQMITWIYNGKGERVQPHYAYSDTIDLSQFPRGDYRLDLSQITSKAGGYFPGSGSISASDHIYIGNLVAGDKLVAIEYVPTTDTTVNSIEIYTTSNQGNNNLARVKILHESGLYIAAFNNDNGPDAAEIYHLPGYKRYVNNQNVLLKAGKKYYIVYQHDDASPGEDTFWPAYFQNENGNYKEYSNNRDQVTTTDISDFGNYIGTFVGTDISSFFSSNENDFANYDGDNGGTGYDAFSQNKIYIRSTTFASQTLKEQLGSGHEITSVELDKILKYNSGDLFIWWGNNYSENYSDVIKDKYIHSRKSTVPTNKYKGIISQISDLADVDVDDYFLWTGSVSYLTQNRLYKKIDDIVVDGDFNFNNYNDDVVKSVQLILASYEQDPNKSNKCLDCTGTFWYADRTGSIFQLKVGSALDFNGGTGYNSNTWVDTPRAANTLVYFSEGANYTINGTPYVYKGAGVHLITDYTNPAGWTFLKDQTLNDFFNITTMDQVYTRANIGDAITIENSVASLVKSSIDSSNISLTLVSATTQNNRKYYLKINGNEV